MHQTKSTEFSATKVMQDRDYSEHLRRHHLRQRDPELRQLVNRLQAVYVSKQIQQQILCNKFMRLQEKVESARSAHILHDTIYAQQQDTLRDEQARLTELNIHRQLLQQQLATRELQRRADCERRIAEKDMMDETAKIVAEEDLREVQRMRDLKSRLHADMMTSQLASAASRTQRELMSALEDQKIEKEVMQAAERIARSKEASERKIKEKENFREMVAAKILAEEVLKCERIEREDIIRELLSRAPSFGNQDTGYPK